MFPFYQIRKVPCYDYLCLRNVIRPAERYENRYIKSVGVTDTRYMRKSSRRYRCIVKNIKIHYVLLVTFNVVTFNNYNESYQLRFNNIDIEENSENNTQLLIVIILVWHKLLSDLNLKH